MDVVCDVWGFSEPLQGDHSYPGPCCREQRRRRKGKVRQYGMCARTFCKEIQITEDVVDDF